MANTKNKSIGALWKRKSGDGKTSYMKGFIELNGTKTEIVLFGVREKKTDKSPDVQILLSEPRKGNGSPAASKKPEATKDDGFNNL